MNFSQRIMFASLLAATGVLMVACGGGGGGGGTGAGGAAQPITDPIALPATGSVNATVTGLRSGSTATLLITATTTTGSQSQSVSITGNGQAMLATGLPAGAAYSVTLDGKPDFQTCTLSGASGTVVAGVVANFSMACTENPMLAYVVNYGSSNISAFSINASTGAIDAITVPGSLSTTGPSPISIAASPDGKFAFVANQGGGVSAYTINPSTGALGTVTGSPFAAGATPFAVTVSPDGRFAYVANYTSNSISAYTINSSTGALGTNTVPGSPFDNGAFTRPTSITVSPNGKFAYVANYENRSVSAYTINPSTGALATVTGSPFRAGGGSWFVTVSPDSKFAYVANYNSDSISAYTIDPISGALGEVAGSPFANGTSTFPSAISISADTKFAYIANERYDSVSVYTIDSSTGALGTSTALSSPFAADDGPVSITLSPDGKFAYTANYNSGSISAYTINPSTGALGAVISSPFKAGTQPRSVVTIRAR